MMILRSQVGAVAVLDDVHADHVAVEEVCDEAPHGLLRCNEHEGCLLQRTHRLQRQICPSPPSPRIQCLLGIGRGETTVDLVGVGVAVDADQLGLRVDAEFAHVVVLEEDAGDPGDLLVRPRPRALCLKRSFGAEVQIHGIDTVAELVLRLVSDNIVFY